AGDLADDLDDIDLLGRVEAIQLDREFGLLRWLLRSGGSSRTSGQRHRRSGRLDLVDLLHVIAQLERLGDGQGNAFVAQFLYFGGPDPSVFFSHWSSLSFLDAVLPEAKQRRA